MSSAGPCEPVKADMRAMVDRHVEYVARVLRSAGTPASDVDDEVQRTFMIAARRREIPYALLDPEDEMPGPEGSFQSKESTRLLLAALARLPLSRRAALVMHELDEVPVADVARALSLTRFGTYARLRKARKELEAAIRRLSREERRNETRSPRP